MLAVVKTMPLCVHYNVLQAMKLAIIHFQGIETIQRIETMIPPYGPAVKVSDKKPSEPPYSQRDVGGQ